ncbi:MAG: hypothetical protein H6806_10125 [Planctomycetes bacterium]|nr:hypothetical protein [Planctomycetota bacterium]MCB9830101.1 hypothetical protein [Planctomycetota bacterium]MCB9899934.1 hypothetical protein [Planctomycetota bacterium]
MTRPDPDRLLAALGSVTRGEAVAGPDATLALARRLVAARHGLAKDPPCPASARRRALSLFRPRPTSWLEALAALTFDSWQGAAAPARGADLERLVRFEHAGTALDLQLALHANRGEASVAVEGLPLEGRIQVRAADGRVLAEAALDVRDTAHVAWTGADEVVFAVTDEDGEVLCTPPLSRGGA